MRRPVLPAAVTPEPPCDRLGVSVRAVDRNGCPYDLAWLVALLLPPQRRNQLRPANTMRTNLRPRSGKDGQIQCHQGELHPELTLRLTVLAAAFAFLESDGVAQLRLLFATARWRRCRDRHAARCAQHHRHRQRSPSDSNSVSPSLLAIREVRRSNIASIITRRFVPTRHSCSLCSGRAAPPVDPAASNP